MSRKRIHVQKRRREYQRKYRKRKQNAYAQKDIIKITTTTKQNIVTKVKEKRERISKRKEFKRRVLKKNASNDKSNMKSEGHVMRKQTELRQKTKED